MRIFFIYIFIVLTSTISKAQGDNVVIKEINISGNRITRENIILRELAFEKGDTITLNNSESLLNSSRENLLNTSLFNYVTITSSINDSSWLNIDITVEERWYTWPSVILQYDDRNFSAWLKSKDLSRSKYGFSVERINLFGKKQNLRISMLFGFASQFMISYRNIALDKGRKNFLGVDIEYLKQDEVIYKTFENRPLTYKNSFEPVFEMNKYTVNYTYRPYIYDLHKLYFNYIEFHISDTIIDLNPSFLNNNIERMNCFTLDYVYSNDKRDIKAYPLHGSYFELLIGQTISADKQGDRLASTVIVPGFYKFLEINKRLYYASGVNMKLSFNNTNSYLYSRSLGYNYNLHGFEYNTIEGEHFIMFKNLLKLALLKEKVYELSFIPLAKFNKIHYALYFNIYADCGYVSKRNNTPDNSYANRFLYSAGAGLDLVTYYDRTLRAEYSINGFGISGLYFHLTAPINN